VSGRVVLLDKPIFVLPLVWAFTPNALSQPLQNLIVVDRCSSVLEAFVPQMFFFGSWHYLHGFL
jgi:hypothetical protein